MLEITAALPSLSASHSPNGIGLLRVSGACAFKVSGRLRPNRKFLRKLVLSRSYRSRRVEIRLCSESSSLLFDDEATVLAG